MTLKNLLFDLDGTLTNPAEGIVGCIKHALNSLHIAPPPDTELLKYIGPPLRGSFVEMLGDENLAERALTAYRERFSTIGMFENEVYPDIPNVLSELRETGFNLLVATGKPEPFAVTILKHFGLFEFFSHVYGSSLIGENTDKADLIAHLLKERAFDPTDCLMIGDRKHDIIGAHKNGVKALGVLWGFGSREELEQASADFLAEYPDTLTVRFGQRGIVSQPGKTYE
jgi:phosphoglycolate phosphatase